MGGKIVCCWVLGFFGKINKIFGLRELIWFLINFCVFLLILIMLIIEVLLMIIFNIVKLLWILLVRSVVVVILRFFKMFIIIVNGIIRIYIK